MPGEVKLKPCPFCGREPVVSKDSPTSLKKAIESWNRRAPEPVASDELFGKAIKASYEEGIEKGRESVKTEPGTIVIRWTRYDGTPETLPEGGDRVLLVRVNQRKFRPDMYEFEIHDGVNKWNDFIDRFDVHVGDCWVLLPEPPEGIE